MVTALFVKNYTGLQFCCTAHLDSEQEEICNFMTDVKSIVKPGYCVRVAQLTRDYFFYGGVSHYFSFHLRVQGNKESVLVLKVKNQDSDTAANLLFGIHALPFGTCTPEFKWERSSSWSTSYWQFIGEGGLVQCIEIKYKSLFTGGDSDLEFVFSTVPIPSKKFAEVKKEFLYDFEAPSPDLRIVQVAWHQETKKIFGEFASLTEDSWMHPDEKKILPMCNFYLPSPRWKVITPWRPVEEGGAPEWVYSQRLRQTNWTPTPKSHPLAIRRRAYTRELLCKNFYPPREDYVSLQPIDASGFLDACGALVEQLREIVGDAERFEWLMGNLKGQKIDNEICIGQILDTFRFEVVKARIVRVLGVEGCLGAFRVVKSVDLG